MNSPHLPVSTASDAARIVSKLHHPVGVVAGPQLLEVELIDEDPDQPRKKDSPGFSMASLQGLAATIAARGLKSPISVRPHPQRPGRLMINHGARRLRAVKLLEQTRIRGYVDKDYSHDDQVIENLQRNNLTARELAEYVGVQVGKGRSQAELARALGVSTILIHQHYHLLNLPEVIAEAVDRGRARDVTLINELLRAYRRDDARVTEWLADKAQEITRGSVKLLNEFIAQQRPVEGDWAHVLEAEAVGEAMAVSPPVELDADAWSRGDPNRLRRAVVRIRHEGRAGRLVLNRRPTRGGLAWIKDDATGNEQEADLSEVSLVALVGA